MKNNFEKSSAKIFGRLLANFKLRLDFSLKKRYKIKSCNKSLDSTEHNTN
jgi:hypothetical protein